MPRVTHILFDFFGTLVTYVDRLEGHEFPRSHDLVRSLGADLSYPEFLAASEWNAGVCPVAGIADLLTGLAAEYRLAVVSNTQDAILVPDHLRAMGVRHLLDAVTTSLEVGWRKPNPRIYAAALLPAAAPRRARRGQRPPVAARRRAGRPALRGRRRRRAGRLEPVERCAAMLAALRDGRFVARPSFFQLQQVRKARQHGLPMHLIAREDVLILRRVEGGRRRDDHGPCAPSPILAGCRYRISTRRRSGL